MRIQYTILNRDHLEDLHQLNSYDEVNRYNVIRKPTKVAETKSILMTWLNHSEQHKIYHLRLKGHDHFIGFCGLKIGRAEYKIGEIWFKILPDFWHKGYATEVVKTLTQEAFEKLNLHRIEAGCAAENRASRKVLLKSGFQEEGLKRQHLPLISGWSDCYEFALLKEEYEQL